jgi:hypothetical protein
MIIGALPVPPVYAALGAYYGVLLLFGGILGVFLFYGMWNLRNWARIILLFLFPTQVIFNIILDPAISENYFLLVLSIVISGYLLLPSTKDYFSGELRE